MTVSVSAASDSNEPERYPRVDAGPREPFMRIRVDFAPHAYAFMSIAEAALLHTRLGGALVEAGKVIT